jgi:hypothetical protein
LTPKYVLVMNPKLLVPPSLAGIHRAIDTGIADEARHLVRVLLVL